MQRTKFMQPMAPYNLKLALCHIYLYNYAYTII